MKILRVSYAALGACAFWLGHCLLWHHFEDELITCVVCLTISVLAVCMSEDLIES